jgi:glutaredoxin
MKPVTTIQKYKCDFCKKRSIKRVMEVHERRCFRNPNRYCDYCENKGTTTESESGYQFDQPCPFCSRFDKKILEEIVAREKRDGVILPPKEKTEIPF